MIACSEPAMSFTDSRLCSPPAFLPHMPILTHSPLTADALSYPR